MSEIADRYEDEEDEEGDGIDVDELTKRLEELSQVTEYARIKEAQAEILARKEKAELLERKKLAYKRFSIFYGSLSIGGLLISSAYNKVLFTTLLEENWQVVLGPLL